MAFLQLHGSKLKYLMAQKSVNRKKSLVLTGMFRFKRVNSRMSQLHALFRIQLLRFSACTVFFCKFSK
jgi:hypothetical protein